MKHGFGNNHSLIAEPGSPEKARLGVTLVSVSCLSLSHSSHVLAQQPKLWQVWLKYMFRFDHPPNGPRKIYEYLKWPFRRKSCFCYRFLLLRKWFSETLQCACFFLSIPFRFHRLSTAHHFCFFCSYLHFSPPLLNGSTIQQGDMFGTSGMLSVLFLLTVTVRRACVDYW